MSITPRKKIYFLGWLTIFVVFFALYAITCQRSISWQESGWYQFRVLQRDFWVWGSSRHIALTHPLYILGCSLFSSLQPQCKLPFMVNLFSGLGMAIALANLFIILVLITKRPAVGFLITGMLGITHGVWSLSTMAEVYTWSVAGLTVEILILILLLRKPKWYYLTLLTFVNGIGLSIHNFALIPLPIYVGIVIYLIIKRRIPVWSLIVGFLAYIIGGALFLIPLVYQFKHHDLMYALKSALFGGFGDATLNIYPQWKLQRENFALIGISFFNLLPLLAIIGGVQVRKRLGNLIAIPLIVITIGHLIFFIRYSVPDQWTFILPSLIMIAILAGVGLDYLTNYNGFTQPLRNCGKIRTVVWICCIVSIALQPLVYLFLPMVIKKLGMTPISAKEYPFRDLIRYYVVPWKHNEVSALRYATAVLEEVTKEGSDAVLIADGSSYFAIVMAQRLYGIAREVPILKTGKLIHNNVYAVGAPADFRGWLGNRKLYLTSLAEEYVSPFLLRDAEFYRPEGRYLYRLISWRND